VCAADLVCMYVCMYVCVYVLYASPASHPAVQPSVLAPRPAVCAVQESTPSSLSRRRAGLEREGICHSALGFIQLSLQLTCPPDLSVVVACRAWRRSPPSTSPPSFPRERCSGRSGWLAGEFGGEGEGEGGPSVLVPSFLLFPFSSEGAEAGRLAGCRALDDSHPSRATAYMQTSPLPPPSSPSSGTRNKPQSDPRYVRRV